MSAMMRQIHWTAPALMVGSLIVGVLFALGHHLFYASLDRKHASTSLDGYDVLGMHVSTQQSNTAIGTAFAFLVRACLLLSISTAYFQILIWSVRKHETRGTKLVHLDVMTSALNDLLSLASFKIWWRRPWLWVLAVIAWLIPLASIITPATLSVGVDSPSPIYMNVPNVEFSSLNLVAPMADNSLSSSDETTDTPFNFMYAGPSLTVQRIAKAVAAQGAILPVVAPAVNSSWDYDFHGPSLRCQPTSSGFRNDVLENILTYTFARKPVTGRTNCTFGPAYVAWHPGFMSPDDSMSEYLPFNIHNLNASRDPLNDDNSHGYPIADMASIFLAITPTLFSSALKEDLDTFDGPAIYHGKPWYQAGLDKYHGTSTVLRCNMHNSTYRTTFSFVNGVQEIIVESVKDVTNTPMITTGEVQVFFNSPDQADQSLRPQACPSSDPEKSKSACVTDPLALPTLSYQAVMHAFQDLVTGMISLGDREDLLTFVTSTTQLSSTILADAPELAFLESPQTYPGLRPSMQQRAATWEQQPFTGLLNARASTNSTLPFQQALEQLFQNITLSLMSAPELQPNASSIYYPDMTEVHLTTLESIYIYAASKLWLAYGLAIGATALIVLLGIAAIIANDASFSNKFSTILRLSRGAQLSYELNHSVLSGRDPLPDYAKKATVRISQQLMSATRDRSVYTLVDKDGKEDEREVTTQERRSEHS